MPNILQQAEMLKDVSDQRIQQEMQRPTGQFPLYLVSSEAKRRADLRQRLKAEQSGPPPQTTVQQDLMAALAGQVPPTAQPISPNRAVAPGQGPGSPLNPQGTPPTGVPLPPPQRGFAHGGMVRGYQGGGLLDLGVGTSPFAGFSYDPRRVPSVPKRNVLDTIGESVGGAYNQYVLPFAQKHFGRPQDVMRRQENVRINEAIAQREADFDVAEGIRQRASTAAALGKPLPHDFARRDPLPVHDFQSVDEMPGDYYPPGQGRNYPITDMADWDMPPYVSEPPDTTAKAAGIAALPKRRTEAEYLAAAQKQLGFTAKQPATAAAPPGADDFDPYNFKLKGPDPYAEVKKQLAERKEGAASDKGRDIGLAIAGIGAGIAGGESQFAVTNIGEGFSKGLPGLQKVFTDARARKDKDIALDTAMISADQAYKSAERKFALDVRNGDRTWENAKQQLQLKQSELLMNTVNQMRTGDYKERVLDETAKHHAALIAKPGGTVAALQMVLDAKPKDLEKILKYSKTGKTLDDTLLVNSMSEWRKITRELGLTAKSSTEDWKQAKARLNTAVPGSSKWNFLWEASRGMVRGDDKLKREPDKNPFYGGLSQ